MSTGTIAAMRLRRLGISGFKTFASRAEVTFDRGITAVVGPNGSGKSNLVDALRWALGETSAKELRGQRMDEVIYAGGGKRNRVNVAEVELTIDNDEGRLPVADPEVGMSRRVVRGAENTEYRLNGERIRLRDLERLLATTGLTQNGYAVVAQNDIDGIIEAAPQQRRALVEQAAGVRSLRAACEDAVSRLAPAEAVVRRMNDLLADASPRLDELAGQAETALLQRELVQRLSELRGSLAREEWRAARGRLKLARRRLEQANSRWEAAREADAAFAERAGAERSRLEDLRTARDRTREALEEAALDAERASAAARQWRERLRGALLRRRAAREDATTASSDRSRLESNTPSGLGPGATNVLEAARSRHWERSREAARAEQELQAAAADLARARDDLSAALAAEREMDALERETRVQLELFDTTGAALQSEVDVAAAAVEGLLARIGAARSDHADATASLSTAEGALAARQEGVESAWSDVNAAEEAVAQASLAARDTLRAAAETHGRLAGALGGEGAVARAVHAGMLQGRRLTDVVRVRDAGDELAIAAALELHASAWLVPDLESAAVHLDAEGPREAILGEERSDGTERVPGRWRAAVDAVEVDAAAEGTVARLLAGVWLTPTLGEARAALAAGARIAVLPDGRALEQHGARGGRPGLAISLAAEDREAESAAAAATRAEAGAIAAVAGARERLAEAEAAAASAGSAVQAERARQAAASGVLVAAEEELGRAERRLANARQQLETRGDERSDILERRSLLEERRAAVAAQVAECRERLGATEAQIDRLREQRDMHATAVREVELELARTEGAEAEASARERERVQALAAADARHEAALGRIALAESEARAAASERRAAAVEQATARLMLAELRGRLEATTPGLAELERAVVALENEHAEVAVALARAEDERAAAEGEVAAAEEEVGRLAEAAREEGDDDLDWDPSAAERTEREIVRLERRVTSLGPVNALAPEQHSALRERVVTLEVARNDIDAACIDVQRLARSLAADLERRFDAVFEAVSGQFAQLFAELFPGGRASLRLEEPPMREADEAEAEAVAERRPGVEILAQPPGKRLGPLRLLSGGERALTALAFVLALQQVNPSPFYVFDEVDAALDDSNVLRFTRLLRRLSEEQQFIVVTHNHITMAAADVLWGVTIDSDGVSTVIGVRFDPDRHPEDTAVRGLEPIPVRATR